VTTSPARQAPVCHVLDEDAGLAESVHEGRRDQAIEECTARCVNVPTGRWHWNDAPDPDALGLLVLEGVLIRKVAIDGRSGAELLGEGDVLRPWQEDAEPATLRAASEWRVLAPARVAVLDGHFTRLLGRHPELGCCLMSRAIQRSRHLTVNMAIVHQARVDVRLHMLLWHLAARWGRVRGDGVTVPIRLTHTVLADLVAARRPTVTTALRELSKRGAVRTVDDGWLLAGQPPGEFVRISHSSLHPVS
jgi:CRP/FNR family transcriptional regulator, cyclic AMP receptor protein